MKNVFTYLLLIVCIAIYVVSLSEPITKRIATYKYKSNSILRSDKYRYGDLFGMSYYPGFQIPISNKATVTLNKCDTNKKQIDLYGLCDSYLWSMNFPDTVFCNVNKWKYATINKFDNLQAKLDTAKVNVLLIEFVERSIAMMLQDRITYMDTFLTLKKAEEIITQPSNDLNSKTDFLFNKNINTNIEFNVFETAIFTPIKKLKAAFNYTLLKTLDTNVAIGPDKKYLLYKPTVDPSSLHSSFRPISDVEVDTMVNRLNLVYHKYKQMGFREVYFSMIPNPVSILYPDYNGYKYNQLISRIQNHLALQMPVIDIYSDFKNTQLQIYQKSDSHWNMDGAIIWLNKLNYSLSRINK
jgi:hypothetical protein